MRIMANVGMVMNLDKCIGCHTCSVTCKQVWTNRPGVEYVWFNNVETKPGLGYPRRYEDQERWRGGWELDRRGRLRLRGGGWIHKLLTIFANPDLPSLDDYAEPWTYDYETLFTAPLSRDDPVARARSRLTGAPIALRWGSNWDDNLAGAPEMAGADPNLRGIEERVQFEFAQAFMFYLPRICEHCLNPSCVASCPSGAMYKREEDGIVLVDQNQCRGWRFCVSGCPYKKVYFNHLTGKAEKCTFCYPRVEAGQPTICSETCVGRLRYLGLVLYDADRVEEAAAVADPRRLLEAQLRIFCDPSDPAIRAQARRDGIPEDWVDAACRSPVYALAARHRVALPLHPEYRTLPMVWYVPPLSPVVHALTQDDVEPDPDRVFHAVEHLRIPIEYLANLLAAGDPEPVRTALRRLAALRAHMREREFGGRADPGITADVGMAPAELDDLYRLLAIAKYEDRYVIPPAHTETADRLAAAQGGCSVGWERQFTESVSHFKLIHIEARRPARPPAPPGSRAPAEDLVGRLPADVSAAEKASCGSRPAGMLDRVWRWLSAPMVTP
jgi:nitrate reductase beta subunit